LRGIEAAVAVIIEVTEKTELSGEIMDSFKWLIKDIEENMLCYGEEQK
jgi:hypothetical protein